MQRKAELGAPGSLRVLGVLTDHGPKLRCSDLLPMRQKRDTNNFTCSTKQVPGAKSGSVQQEQSSCQKPRKEGEPGASYRAPPRQHWLLPALEWGWREALRLSPTNVFIASMLVPRTPPPGSCQDCTAGPKAALGPALRGIGLTCLALSTQYLTSHDNSELVLGCCWLLQVLHL